MNHNTANKFKIIVDFVFYACIAFATFLVVKYGLKYFLPFLIAYTIATIVQPVINKITRKYNINKKAVSVISVIGVWLIIVIAVFVIVFIIFKQLSAILNDMNSISQAISIANNSVRNFINNIYSKFPQLNIIGMENSNKGIYNTLYSFISKLFGDLLETITQILSKMPSAIIFILVSVLSSIFLAIDYEGINLRLKKLLKNTYYAKFSFIKQFAFGTIAKIIKAYLLIILITAIELFIGLLIINVDYAFTIAILIALFDILPIVGSGTVLVPWALIELISKNYKNGIGLLVLCVIITIVRNIIEPKIIGKKTNTHPLLILISVYIGGKVLGFYGVLIFPTLIMLLSKLYRSGYFKIK